MPEFVNYESSSLTSLFVISRSEGKLSGLVMFSGITILMYVIRTDMVYSSKSGRSQTEAIWLMRCRIRFASVINCSYRPSES